MRWVLNFIFLFIGLNSFGQNPPVDSLNQLKPFSTKKILTPSKQKNRNSKQSEFANYRSGKKIMRLDSFVLEKNVIIRLPHVKFKGGTHELLSAKDALKEINYMIDILKKYPSLKIQIQGHICCVSGGGDGYHAGTGSYNLSVMRARLVYLFMIKKGIEKERLSYVGFGSSNKIYKDDFFDPIEAELNRRIEIEIMEL